MTTIKKPYFMTNKNWYEHDEKEGTYKLTKKAPVKAKVSYRDFYKKINKHK